MILHGPTGMQVQGLTTATTIWITASLGVLCGLAVWKILAIAFVLTFLLLIAGIPGKSITVTDFIERVGASSFLTGTAVVLESSSTGVLVATLGQAQLTANALLTRTSAGVTLGAGFATPLPAGEGLSIAGTGSAFTNGSTLQSTIVYQKS